MLDGNWARKAAGSLDLRPFWSIVVPNVTPNVLVERIEVRDG